MQRDDRRQAANPRPGACRLAGHPRTPANRARRGALRQAVGLAALLAAASMGGCGFRLRGAIAMPFRTLHLASATPLALELRRQLRAADIVLTDKAEGADAVLDLPLEGREREILAFSSTGRPREYQLRLRVTFRLHDGRDRDFIPTSEIVLRRDVITNDLQIATRFEEEALLFRDMQTDAVQQLLRRLGAARL